MAIQLLTNEKLWLEQDAVHQLSEFAKFDDVIDVIGLPDLHVGVAPVGATFKTRDLVYPFFIGNDIGCGMMLVDTETKLKKFNQERFSKKLEDTKISGEYSIGGGNHFAEFEAIDKIFNKEEAQKLNLSKNTLYVLVHTGSRNMGAEIYKQFNETIGLDRNSNECKKYMDMHNNALIFAKENRNNVAKILCEYVGINSNNRTVIDCVHNAIIEHDGYFYHHKGSVSTLNQYAIIAGTRGTNSYIVKCIPNEDKLFSISHGAGRKWPRNLCKGRLLSKYKKDELRTTKIGSKIITDKQELLYEEAPEAYKNVNDVITILENEGLIEVVASLKPLLTYKC